MAKIGSSGLILVTQLSLNVAYFKHIYATEEIYPYDSEPRMKAGCESLIRK